MAGGEKCSNCGALLERRYCPECGQDRVGPPRRLLPLLWLFGRHLTGMEGVVVKTTKDLLFRPGRLTRAYLDGQRARYAGPVQVYLWSTAALFLLHAYIPFVRLDLDTGAVRSTLSALTLGTKLSPSTLDRISRQGESLASFAPRFDAAVSAYLPVLLLVLVAACGFLMAALFRREEPVTHAVFALHWTAFYFLLETVRRVVLELGTWGAVISAFGLLAAIAYLAIAMRRVYRRSRLGSVVRAALSVVVFAALLFLWLWSTSVVAAGLASWGAF